VGGVARLVAPAAAAAGRGAETMRGQMRI
jgi:hypothetical protein